MKALAIVGVSVLVVAAFYVYTAGHAEQNARFIRFKNCLKDAQVRLSRGEDLSKQYRLTRVYMFTNSYVIAGTNYHCELAGENKWFTNGVLAITTNQSFLWIDRKVGAIPLTTRDILKPPRF